MSWAPAVLFAALACFLLQKAIRPGARRTWGWGRTGGPVPVSRLGYAVWGIALAVAAAITVSPEACLPRLAAALLACFVAILAVGFRDTRAHRRSAKARREREG